MRLIYDNMMVYNNHPDAVINELKRARETNRPSSCPSLHLVLRVILYYNTVLYDTILYYTIPHHTTLYYTINSYWRFVGGTGVARGANSYIPGI